VKSPRLIRQQRGNPLLRERVHDPYRAGEKLREATRCPQCGVRYKNGRWAWHKRQTFALKSQHCPACRRVNDRYPAGEIVLSGEFADSHRAEVLSRARNVEASERSEHPLHRIMSIEKRGEGTVITTTDIHLPHRIGHALQDAWGGQLKTHYDREGYFTRVQWERNE
jgi:NMD protein affecting ribosome stability and mRNA decay